MASQEHTTEKKLNVKDYCATILIYNWGAMYTKGTFS